MRSWARRTEAKTPLYFSLKLSGASPALHQTHILILKLPQPWATNGHYWCP